jgi:hypothetical protein
MISTSRSDLILRSIAQAMRLEGWPRATACKPPSFETPVGELEPIGFTQTLV